MGPSQCAVAANLNTARGPIEHPRAEDVGRRRAAVRLSYPTWIHGKPWVTSKNRCPNGNRSLKAIKRAPANTRWLPWTFAPSMTVLGMALPNLPLRMREGPEGTKPGPSKRAVACGHGRVLARGTCACWKTRPSIIGGVYRSARRHHNTKLPIVRHVSFLFLAAHRRNGFTFSGIRRDMQPVALPESNRLDGQMAKRHSQNECDVERRTKPGRQQPTLRTGRTCGQGHDRTTAPNACARMAAMWEGAQSPVYIRPRSGLVETVGEAMIEQHRVEQH